MKKKNIKNTKNVNNSDDHDIRATSNETFSNKCTEPCDNNHSSTYCDKDCKCSNVEEKNTEDSIAKDLNKEIEILKEQVLFEKANTINSINRMNRERAKQLELTENRILADFLKILDYYNSGMQYANTLNSPEVKNLVFGLKMVQSQIEEFIREKAVQSFESADQIFDPTKHNPINTVESADCKIPKISKQFSPGYIRKGAVIKLANVEVTTPCIETKKNNVAEKDSSIESEKATRT